MASPVITREDPLGSTPFFNSFPVEQRQSLAKSATRRKYRRNTYLFVSGEDSHALYVLLKGTAQAFSEDERGEEFILRTYQSGDCFGEFGVLDGSVRSASVVTTSECECMVIPRADMQRIVYADPSVCEFVIRSLLQRLRSMTEEVSSLALLDVYGRVARLLNSSGVEDGAGRKVVERMTQQHLANRVGSSRDMVGRILKDLRDDGYIDIEKSQIVLRRELPRQV